MKSIKVLGMALLGMSIIMASCSGEDGKDGLDGNNGTNGTNGTNGDPGDPGADGLACWDLNGNGSGDAAEDINQDGSFDALDCAGMDGQDGADGQDGSDKPNMDFYFQEGFKGYVDNDFDNGTQDATLNQADPNVNYKDATTLQVTYSNLDNDGRNVVMRFDALGDPIISNLVESGETCADGFYLNQATLYLYLNSYIKIGAGVQESISLHFGFYGPDDTNIFDEEQVTWVTPDGINLWPSTGGGSMGFVGGLTAGQDDYQVPILFNESGAGSGVVGWVAIPLPRSVVSDWICNPDSNKGFRIRIDSNDVNSTSLVMNFISSENDNEDLRPLLVIETEDVEPSTTTKMAPSGKAKDWDSMSYEEKMAPLYRYFAAKGL